MMVVSAAAGDLAKVNGRTITDEDLADEMASLPQNMRHQMASSEAMREMLDNLIAEEVLYQESQKTGLSKDQKVQKQVLDATRKIMVNAYVNRIVEEKITKETTQKYYDQHRTDFGEVHAGHILLATEEDARSVKKQLEQGADFGELAQKMSKDPSAAQNKGDLGFFTKDRMVKPFADQAFSMKVNQISDPVKTRFGYHIIKLIEIKTPKKFEEMSEREVTAIKRAILGQEIEALKAKAKIVVFEEKFKPAPGE
jgi:peptidyl-prolyl cis-trans isomerase C